MLRCRTALARFPSELAVSLSLDDLSRYEREATRFYVLWFAIYIVLGLGAIILPGLAAMGLTLRMADAGGG
jgi:hypothetical protein